MMKLRKKRSQRQIEQQCHYRGPSPNLSFISPFFCDKNLTPNGNFSFFYQYELQYFILGISNLRFFSSPIPIESNFLQLWIVI